MLPLSVQKMPSQGPERSDLASDTSRITGFPTSEDPYATLSPNTVPDALLVLTRVRPRSAN